MTRLVDSVVVHQLIDNDVGEPVCKGRGGARPARSRVAHVAAHSHSLFVTFLPMYPGTHCGSVANVLSPVNSTLSHIGLFALAPTLLVGGACTHTACGR
jgi:hypothetical protein